MNLSTILPAEDFEQIVLCCDAEAGLRSVIAVHDTSLGPALGGIRMRRYPDQQSAVRDALNLAEAMTYKAALAGLDLGGGKSVINLDPTSTNRDRALEAHARYIANLGGRYIPAVDMGTTVRDLELVGRWVDTVASERRDPSYYTALGVVASIASAVRLCDGVELTGLRVAVQGLGHVGAQVARLLVAAGAVVAVADVDPAKVRAARAELGVVAVAVADILTSDVDVVCPCAGGAAVTTELLSRLKARYVIGAANNVLAEPELAELLTAHGVVHVPDFVANAGGLIACAAEIHGDDTNLLRHVDQIGLTTERVLRLARAARRDPVSVAVELAHTRLDACRAARPHFPRRPIHA